ncbi:MAG: metallophosphoesterase [Pseudomonadota bacterium]
MVIKKYLSLLLLFWGCRTPPLVSDLVTKDQNAPANSCALIINWERNFSLNPSVLDIKGVTEPIYLIGDIHGEILKIHPVIKAAGLDSGTLEKPVWNGKKAIFVVVGDFINKGPNSLETIKYLMKLEHAAEKKGGRVIVLAGNHEISFLINPFTEKTEAFRNEMAHSFHDICNSVYDAKTAEGRWLRDRPAALRINGLFASHSGFPKWDLTEIDMKFRDLFGSSGTRIDFACGDTQGDKKSQGFFNARNWWYQGNFQQGLEKLQVFQILFAHDPNAFSDRGKIRGYFGDHDGRALIKLDVGVQIGDSNGEILRCETWSQNGSCGEFRTIRQNLKRSEAAIEEILPIERGPPPSHFIDDPQKEC